MFTVELSVQHFTDEQAIHSFFLLPLLFSPFFCLLFSEISLSDEIARFI